AYPLFMGALWTLGRDVGRGGDALLDALIVGVSAGVLGWGVLIAPYVNDPGLTPAQLLVGAAYPVADLILLPLLLRLVFLHRARIHAHRLLLAGMLFYLVADTLYWHGTTIGWYEPGGVTDGFWLAAYALFAAAAWHPSAAIESPVQVAPLDQSGAHVAFLAVAAVVTPLVILVTAGTDVQLVRVAAIGSILLFALVMVRLGRLMRRVRRQSARLEALARTDPLTGAANRRSLDDELDREVARSERTDDPLCLAFLDFDHFKHYNDTYGHGAGDTLLQDAVIAWRGALRPTDVLARTGGEEFVVVFPHTDLQECREAVERLRALMPGGETCSAGIARFRRGDSRETLLQRADQALYVAKNGGRNRAVDEEGISSAAS
ncbi:MAG: GGDEF domain-containing protein, partial [Halofilum sp. (in: g-proteobacteria)]